MALGDTDLELEVGQKVFLSFLFFSFLFLLCFVGYSGNQSAKISSAPGEVTKKPCPGSS
jgi:hypothetical protein